ncbi:hypothetical protein BV898_13286 [Hypsibius exemplaris]|uniref:Uncharacterized protein n=1 Tax=Hypsibius exemplaris TaxID=2072580 RepID=A0A1W0WB89_HYPEX|nr:hypothetical protein BV898_13286 [Hypsibius exemplaris]
MSASDGEASMKAKLTSLYEPVTFCNFTVSHSSIDRFLSRATCVELAVILTALYRGRAHWNDISWSVWAHLGTLIPALALTPWILPEPKGTQRHRVLGYAWISLMATTSLISFNIRDLRQGKFSLIHFLSVFALQQCGMVIATARAHNLAKHRDYIRGMIVGALLGAGFFTFPFGRILGKWLFG